MSQLAISLDAYMSQQGGYTRPYFGTRVVGIDYMVPSDPPPECGDIDHVTHTTGTKPERVTTGQFNIKYGPPPDDYMVVRLADGRTRRYSHVITTTTLPCLRTMDLTAARLDWQQKEAIGHWKIMRSVLPDVFWETY